MVSSLALHKLLRKSQKTVAQFYVRVARSMPCWGLASFIALSQADVNAAEYRIEHCLYGCPEGANADNHLLLRPIYALSFNTLTKSADWVAYKVSADTIGIASSLSREPVVDDFVADTLQDSDFTNLEAAGLVRSQYVPLVNFAATPYWGDVNFQTNLVARSRNLNQGAWYGLEWSIRNMVNREGEVYVLAGPIFEIDLSVRPLRVARRMAIPDAFFKIVITEDGQASAFRFNQDLPVHIHHCEMIVPIEEIENATGLVFFPEASQVNFNQLSSKLGCR